MRSSLTERIVNHAILGLFALLTLVPILGVLLSSVTPAADNDGSFAFPRHLALGNYIDAWHLGNFGQYMTTSVIVCIAVVALNVVLSVSAGYAFARMSFFGSSVLYYLLLLGLTLPAEAFIIPLYFNLRSAHLTDTYWALILPQTAQSLAFGIFWMRNHFQTFPGEIIEAARLDGARDFGVLWRVVVPPALPSIMTMCVVVTMWTWNEFLVPLVMASSGDLRTAPLGLAFFQGKNMTQYSLLAAAGVLVALPIALLYLALQKRFISGMAGGVSHR
ncbi:MAG: carbohydrate ABC transporter permease [Gordonia sp. (in: high G+C Gram-positive bacteria)]